ncbi:MULTISPECIES: DUF423 domain-containing protein [unclassified Paenibacillus]|uniref:DUF423 domain-containing protein n=1 Tax=unclassified Paenibacillus TaxID=185978 RepID=UPI002404EC68|nr:MULTISPECIES: DUF423 domain-containing protein [unclassified Paenibacillus]MDF9841812.1 uncharacterized membrane protein YgdD (TMEM256/DUF423 family) [Paenibacillus sp. PastF-2]MDF9848507.1 uncharacterized membrane protein YgdD (TMEM256/DUF423 family) [Paenibacillus sp. PastM-2]MDF9854972.1 uncharacterized membrane protein YgdD (TMEM256/DUF423 family) [Paenibacillus sp. PastF-1]MDH6480241.1 uncharacterized membrane protein YgdD (TMEM256/DUF423 family) [Paenibacillus sp. PastH-2]MDH6507775.1
MQRKFMAWGAILAMLSVMIGAFGAHMLKTVLSGDDLAVYETGVHYHMVHAIGLLVIAVLIGQWGESARLRWAGWLLIAGIVLFSGSLYVLSISGISILGAITPLGGVCFIAGWVSLAWEALSRKS